MSSVDDFEDGPVVQAVRRDLCSMPVELSGSALAASAIVMARGLDNPGASLTSQSMAQARLQDVMDRLRELAPARVERDDLDEISARRARRLAGGG